MNRKSRTAALSFMAVFLIACTPFVGKAAGISPLSIPEKWLVGTNAADSGRTLNLAALESRTAQPRLAVLREAKRDYTIVAVDDNLLREPASPKQPRSDLAAVAPGLAAIPDNHNFGSSFDDESPAQTIAASMHSSCRSSGTPGTGDTPAHSRKYLQSKK